MAHTPGPWIKVVDEESEQVGWRGADGWSLVLADDCELSEDDKEFVFRAANAHDELLDGLRDIYERSFHSDDDSTLEIRRIASSLLAKHGGTQ